MGINRFDEKLVLFIDFWNNNFGEVTVKMLYICISTQNKFHLIQRGLLLGKCVGINLVILLHCVLFVYEMNIS